MNTLKFTDPTDIQDILWGEGKWEEVEEELVETSRWSVIMYIVVQNKETNLFYGYSFAKAATEYQENEEFDEMSPLVLTQVHQVEKTVLVWENV